MFDLDAVVFRISGNGGAGKKRFSQYVKYYLSDHRPMWMEFRIALGRIDRQRVAFDPKW